jgi:hypothetical protein
MLCIIERQARIVGQQLVNIRIFSEKFQDYLHRDPGPFDHRLACQDCSVLDDVLAVG